MLKVRLNNSTNFALPCASLQVAPSTVGDAENIVKSAVCRAIRKVYLALKQFLGVFVAFPSHLRSQVVKQSLFLLLQLHYNC